MKKSLLLPAFLLVFCAVTRAQEASSATIQRTEQSDSLTVVFQEIDNMSVFELKKQREAYVYKCRLEPSDRNKAILAYIEKRMTSER